MKLKNAVTLVAGGASGLGWAVVQDFLAHGATVGVLDLDKEESREKIKSLGAAALFCPADITRSDQVQAELQTLEKKYGTLQVVVNCAGVASAARTIKDGKPYPLEIFARTVEVNLTGTFNLARLAAAAMAKGAPDEGGERGVLIHTASIAAYDGQMGQTAYAASKGGIVSLTLPLARDLADLGIRVMTIAPGIFDTPMLALLPEAARLSLGQQVPFPKRLGRPEEFAALARHIVENPMLNGEVIRLDGALRMGMK